MNKKEAEEFAVMKNEITHIKKDVSEIKDMLESHVKWESGKYDSLKEQFADKSVEDKVKLLEKDNVDYKLLIAKMTGIYIVLSLLLSLFAPYLLKLVGLR